MVMYTYTKKEKEVNIGYDFEFDVNISVCVTEEEIKHLQQTSRLTRLQAARKLARSKIMSPNFAIIDVKEVNKESITEEIME